MLKLVGFAASNYYNKVKIALIEKGVPFEEQLNWASKDEPTLACSPLGKIPYVVIDGASLCESQVIMEYIEHAHPSPALLPADPMAAAKVRELCAFLELHLELVARRLYPQAFFGKTVPDEVKEVTRKDLQRNVAAFSRLARFGPYVAGDAFTMADCAAIVHLPLVSMASKAVYGEDLLGDLPVRDYLKAMGARESVQRVNADRKANQELMMKSRG